MSLIIIAIELLKKLEVNDYDLIIQEAKEAANSVA